MATVLIGRGRGRWRHAALLVCAVVLIPSTESAPQALRERLPDHGRPVVGRLPVGRHVPKVRVTGRLLRGTKGVSARLLFTSGEGSAVWMESSTEGRFRGELPRLESGEWDLEVSSRRPALHRRLEGVVRAGAAHDGRVRLVLDLGETGVSGGVISEEGRPQSDVLVRSETLAGEAPAQTLTDSEGQFDLGALAPGSYRVWAESPSGYSVLQQVEVDERSQPDLQLVLKPRRRFAGRVVADARPVTGASVQTWLPTGVPRGDVVTADDGGFDDGLPTDDSEVGVTVIAPGYAITMTRVWLNGQEPVEIALSAEAGELIVQAPADAPASPDRRTVVLSAGGSLELLDYLRQWGTVEIGESGTQRVIVPRIAPGSYAACLLDTSERAALWLGAAPADRCASGTLVAGGRLVLVLYR